MGYFDVLNLSGEKYEKLSVKFMCCITDERNSYLSVKHFHPARCFFLPRLLEPAVALAVTPHPWKRCCPVQAAERST